MKSKIVIEEALNSELVKKASALRGFTRYFRIEGIASFGPREFMQRAKPEVLKLMRERIEGHES